ncbi:SLC13 family permease [Allobranchiibius sp. GilTou38]|uniref:SLC13 family permease n=1 Tax=Allobranchiibius sp. GilTou38 TaxID=2815210 RepID=UPI001AA17105|nr:arsenic transporter [Allobranchiibius sp. GilTou38]
MTHLIHELGPVWPVLAFLLAISVVAEVCQTAGLFEVAAFWAARAGGGRSVRLWLLVVALCVACTAVLSLDTTAVLLSPVAVALARQCKLPPLPFALTAVWLANTASLLLPVSNLTNLLSLQTFSHLGGQSAYFRTAWLPAVTAVVATVVMIAALHPRVLRGGYDIPQAPAPRDKALVILTGATCVVLAPLFVSGITPAIPAVVAAIVLVAALAVRDRSSLRDLTVPWTLALGVLALFVVVEIARQHGLDKVLADLVGAGHGVSADLRLAGVGAVTANVVNNLPAYLALRPTAADTSQRALALLVGVNTGSIVLPWGSLATLLWRDRCKRAGLQINTLRFIGESAAVALVTVVATTLVIH